MRVEKKTEDHLWPRQAEKPVQEQGKILDAELLLRKAFEADPKYGCELLFRHYYQALCSHAIHFVYSGTIAEDIVSELFYQFYEKQLHLRITTSYRAYLYRSVRNSALNYLKCEANRHTNIDVCQLIAASVNQQPDEILLYDELYREIEKAIRVMPEQRRKVYLMHRFEGKKYTEIAQELSLSPRTVEVQIRRAVIYLRGILKLKNLLLNFFL